jgi:hypothetical protein
LAQIGWLLNPELAPVPGASSAFTPGERIATPVKLLAGRGIASSCCFSRTKPFVVSTALTSGVSSTVIVWPTSPIFKVALTPAVRFALHLDRRCIGINPETLFEFRLQEKRILSIANINYFDFVFCDM